MDLRYVSNDQPLPTGRRSMLYQGGRLYTVTASGARREVYDKKPVNLPPVGVDGTIFLKVTR